MSDRMTGLIDILEVLVKWRKRIFINTLVVCVLSLVISLLLPKWYTAKAIILPPERAGLSLGLGSLSEIAGSIMGPSGYELPMLATRADVYETIIKSRRMIASVIEQNNLLKIYKTKNMDKAIKKLRSNLKTEVGRDGSLQISFEAQKDPILAANVANSFVKELDSVNTETSQFKARSTRIFIEQRLNMTKKDLAGAEDALRHFQEEHNTISIEDQTKATIEGAAQLVAEMMALKIQLGVMRQTLSSSHSTVEELTAKINQIDKTLREIQHGSERSDNPPDVTVKSNRLYLPLENVPNLGLQYARLFREVKIQELLFELLTQQYEQAKIKEKEDTPTIQVLEYAVPPLLKSRPKRALIVVVSTVFALFMSGILAFVFEFLQNGKAQNGVEFRRLDTLFKVIKADFYRLRRGNRNR